MQTDTGARFGGKFGWLLMAAGFVVIIVMQAIALNKASQTETRIKAVESELHQQFAALAAEVRSEMNAVSPERLEQVVEEMADKARLQGADIEGLQTSLELTQKGVSALRDDVVEVQKGLAGVADMVGGVETEVGRMTQRIAAGTPERTEELVRASVKEAINSVNESVESVGARIDSVKADVDSVKTDVGSVKTDVGGVKADVGSVKADVGSVREGLDSVKSLSALESMPADVSYIRRRINEIWSDDEVKPLQQIASISGEVSYIRARIDEMRSEEARTATPEIASITGDLSYIRKRIDNLKAESEDERHYTVLFPFGSSDLTPGGLKVIDEFLERERGSDRQIQLYGFTDAIGDVKYNKWLSMQRAMAVRDALIERGIPKENIVRAEARGEERPVEAVTGELREPSSRRVTIVTRRRESG